MALKGQFLLNLTRQKMTKSAVNSESEFFSRRSHTWSRAAQVFVPFSFWDLKSFEYKSVILVKSTDFKLIHFSKQEIPSVFYTSKIDNNE